MNRRIVGGLMLAGLLMLGPGLANAAKSFSTQVTITATRNVPFTGYRISGTVASSDKTCVKGRLVKVYLRRAVDRAFYNTAQAVAKSNGKWALPKNHPLAPGKYYAKADRKGSCRAAKSKTITGSAYY